MSYYAQMIAIMRERERLIVRCEVQRMEIATLARQSEGTIKVIDHVVGVVNYFRGHPMIFGVVVAALALIQRRGKWGWVRRGFMLWRAYRAFGSSRRTA